MYRRAVLCLCLACLIPFAGVAQSPRATDPILDAMRIGTLLEIMAEESAAHGRELDQSMLEGRGGAGWQRTVAAIHDPEIWEARMRARVAEEMPEAQIAAVEAFVTSGQAQRIVDLELSARRALLDPEIEAASRDRLAVLRDRDAPLLERLERFVAANDLIDANVAGALNANLAFLDGLAEGEGDAAPARDAIGDVWAQEPQIRAETEDWVFAYLALAFGPLPAEDLDAYIAFSETPAGQAFNSALFAAFDEMFVTTSRALGLALGRMLGAQDI